MTNLPSLVKLDAKPLFLLLFITIFTALFQHIPAQEAASSRKIEGLVRDENNQPLTGVTVNVKGTSATVVSGQDGRFQMAINDNSSVIVVSHIGFQTQEIEIGNKTNLDIILVAGENRLNEVVVVGYGTQKKVSLTGAVSGIKGEELVRRPVSSVQQALQGQLPGLTILDQGGAPGSSNTVIRVRGITTIGANNNNPLVIVDGIEQPLADLNPNDIESISILKDASSTSIYGSRAANGVVLVTTKRAKSGKTSVSYNGFYAIQQAISKPEHMDLESYMRLQNTARVNVGSAIRYTEQEIQDYVHTADRDKFPLPFSWYDAMYHTAPQTNHAVSISGGKEDVKTLLSVRFQDQDGIIANTNSKLTDIRLNTDLRISSKIKVFGDINYRNKKTLEPVNITNIFLRMMQNSIWTTPVFPDGTYGIGPQGNNPLLFAEKGGLSRTSVDYFTGNAKGEWEIINGLKFTTQLGVRLTYTTGKDFTNSYEIRDYYDPTIIKRTVPINSLTEIRNLLKEFTLNNLLHYTTDVEDHSISILAGYSQIENKVNQLRAYRQGFYNNDIQSIGQGTNDATKDNSGAESQWGLRSYFGRINYDYQDKYLLEANGRYDGSSRFLGDKRYSFFPSFSAGWRLSQEAFWSRLNKYINEFKLRGSWGKTGNQSVDLYSYFTTLNLVNYSFTGLPVQGYIQQKMSNEDITWETTTQSNIGIDAQLMNNRFSLSVDYYNKKTEGILLVLPVPGTFGLQPAPQNAGSVENKGWEFALGSRNRFGEIGFDVNLNLSINQNKVTDLAGTGPYISGDDIDPRYITGEGYPINSFWGYKTDGLFQSEAEIQAYPVFMRAAKPGDVKVLDLNKDGKVNADDMTYIGNSFPKYTFGSSFNLSYKGVGLNLLFQGASDVGVRLARALAEQGNYEGFTHKIYTNNFWTPERPDARFPRPTKQDLRNQASTDRMVIDGSYIRLKNIQLSYLLPPAITKRWFMNQFRLYVSATNVFTISKLTEWNLDPETLSGWQDYYPQTGLYTIGVNVQF
jgi:TonB-linked SusC/RagA family outer membrane protein